MFGNFKIPKPPSKAQLTTINLAGNANKKVKPYVLSEFLFVYVAAIACLVFTATVSMTAYFILHPIIGFIVSRFINERVVWWSQANSIDQIFWAKLTFWIFWPIQTPIYMLKVAIAKFL